MTIKYGELSKKQIRLVKEYAAKHPECRRFEDMEYDKFQEVFNARPAEYLHARIDRMLDDIGWERIQVSVGNRRHHTCPECKAEDSLIIDPIDYDNLYCSICLMSDDRNAIDDNGKLIYPHHANLEVTA